MEGFDGLVASAHGGGLPHRGSDCSSKLHRTRGKDRGGHPLYCRSCVLGRLLVLALATAVLLGPSAMKGTPPRTGFTFQGEGPFESASRRAGGTRSLVGSAVVGAVAGHTVVSLTPIVNLIPFTDLLGTLSGALAGAICAQLPRGHTLEGRLGDVCRSTGRATADLGSAAWRFVSGG
mmetsp:Transcript_15302/g.45850  ORF Transcript_15302/g.45850 Transcript_15302/m.45850 type:complete len:177 (-) Transcript_15302:86-616(-)